MTDDRDILALFDDGPHESAALATLVELVGSGYRRPGARLLLVRDNEGNIRQAGGISGGCLESDLRRRAFDLANIGHKVVAYDTRVGAPAPLDFNTGCAGLLHVLVEHATDAALQPLRTHTPTGLVYHAGPDSGLAVGQRLPLDNVPDSLTATVSPDGTRILRDPHHRPRTLLIFGEGEDARALCTLATAVGFEVIVRGKRPTLTTRGRFSHAARVACRPTADTIGELALDTRSAAVLLTHDLDDDADLLPTLLESECGYVGLLGPRGRTARLMAKLHARGKLPDARCRRKLHAPAGLDIGGDGPHAVALSVLAEIQAVFHDRAGGHLRDRSGPIHGASGP